MHNWREFHAFFYVLSNKTKRSIWVNSTAIMEAVFLVFPRLTQKFSNNN